MDAAEFKQQFLPYHRKLYRTAFRLTENPQEAEDMVQEAYLKLWNKRDSSLYGHGREMKKKLFVWLGIIMFCME